MGLTSELLVRITADGKGVKYGIDDATKYFKKFNEETLSKTTKTLSLLAPKLSESLGGIGEGLVSKLGKVAGFFGPGGMLLAGAGVFAGLWERSAKYAAELVGLSRKLDTTIGRAERLRYAEQTTGQEPGTFDNVISFLRLNRSKALSGDKGALQDFARIGISISDIKRMDPVALFEDIAKRIADGKINAVNFANAVGVMGKEARALVPSMKAASAAMDEFNNSGMASNPDDIQQIASQAKSLKKIGKKAGYGWGRFVNRSALAGVNIIRMGMVGALGLIPTDKTQQWAENIALAGYQSGGTKGVGNSSTEETESMLKRLDERIAIREERIRQKREEDNAYIDEIYGKMYGPGSDAQKAEKASAIKASGAFSFATLTQSDQLARVGLYSSTGAALSQQLQNERDTIATLKSIERKLNSLGIELNKEP